MWHQDNEYDLVLADNIIFFGGLWTYLGPGPLLTAIFYKGLDNLHAAGIATSQMGCEEQEARHIEWFPQEREVQNGKNPVTMSVAKRYLRTTICKESVAPSSHHFYVYISYSHTFMWCLEMFHLMTSAASRKGGAAVVPRSGDCTGGAGAVDMGHVIGV